MLIITKAQRNAPVLLDINDIIVVEGAAAQQVRGAAVHFLYVVAADGVAAARHQPVSAF